MYKIIAKDSMNLGFGLVDRRDIWYSQQVGHLSSSLEGEALIERFSLFSTINLGQALKAYHQLQNVFDANGLEKINFERLSSDQKWIIGKALLLPKHSERVSKSQKEIRGSFYKARSCKASCTF